MHNISYINISIFGLLLVSKLTSSFLNMSPFIATIIIGSYFIINKFHLLTMVLFVQFISDLVFGSHLSNIFVYISYFLIILTLYYINKDFSVVSSFISALYVNIIFFSISNFGHFISYSETYTLTSLSGTYLTGLSFGGNLLFSTLFFVSIYHSLLAVRKKQLAKN